MSDFKDLQTAAGGFDYNKAVAVLKAKGITAPTDDLAMTMLPKDSDDYKKWWAEHQRRADMAVTNDWFKRSKADFLHRGSIYSEKGVLDHNFDQHKTGLTVEENKVRNAAVAMAYRIAIKHEKFNATLTGLPGRGKTFMAVSILNYIHDNAKPALSCMFVSIAKMSQWELQASTSDDQTKKDQVTKLEQRCEMVDVLVLDDFGSESVFNTSDKRKTASEFTQKWMFRMIDARAGKTTIVTTNLSGERLKMAYDGKLISRLISKDPNNTIDFTGIKDHRNRPTQTGLEV